MKSEGAKMKWLLLLPVGLAIVVATSLAGSASARPDARPTQIVVYTPFTINGGLAHGVKLTAQASGYCWEGSVASPRADAWRCFRGNLILDPCFSGNLIVKWVACPVRVPFNKHVLRLNLTKPLPLALGNKTRDPTAGDPTAVRLTTGVICGFAGGATATVAGMRLNYACTGDGWLVGDPHRNTATWTIFYVPNVTSSKMTTVGIATAYW